MYTFQLISTVEKIPHTAKVGGVCANVYAIGTSQLNWNLFPNFNC